MGNIPDGLASTPAQRRAVAAILDTARQLLPSAPASSLIDIAAAAQVSRSTLYRYFPDRTALVKGLAVQAYAEADEAVRRMLALDLAPLVTLRKVVEAHLALGPTMMFLYADPSISDDDEFWASLRREGDPVDVLLARVRVADAEDGMTASWLQRSYWGLLYVGWESMAEQELSASEAAELVVRSLHDGVLGRH
ncbi:TetR/AcrR family transcriptional regulator [Leifsonia sp. LS1]|uniref:TetR/AcrR family transcriptional regulator n=1 Tax=Leifsonia sp. LS1 TaxID=2828483 RepID=UPI001CFEEB8E|nr:TetR/AcrR family transcriptional regulator [Leifsonia sp. LS1]